MEKGNDFDQRTTRTLINSIKDDEEKAFTNKMDMNKLELQGL